VVETSPSTGAFCLNATMKEESYIRILEPEQLDLAPLAEISQNGVGLLDLSI
jgi:hypothetical protein